MTLVIRIKKFGTDGPLCRNRRERTLDARPYFRNREVIVSVVAILLMFLAVMAMVKKIDQDRQRHPILVPEPRGAEDRIRLQAKK